jgi:hypothetical protein
MPCTRFLIVGATHIVIGQATHSIYVIGTVNFLLPFSAQKSLVKPKTPQLKQTKANKNAI